MQNSRFVIFTDLDGSLLNHKDYSFDEAKEMLSFIKDSGIDLIFNTSKTKTECEILQQKMEINSPFIVENGACIYFNENEKELLGVKHKEILSFIDRYKERFEIFSFSNMSIDDLMRCTGFDKKQALLAKRRDFSEPFLLKDKQNLKELKRIAQKEGFKILKGGRFYHCVGEKQDKAEATKRVLIRYKGFESIGLGDSLNDKEMLGVVDIPILIPRYDNTFIDIKSQNLIKAKYPGSRGWNEALKRVFLNES